VKRLTSIEKFKEGISIQGFYLCVEKHLRHTRNGDLYLDLELKDKTGHISAKVWDKVPELNILFDSGDAVAVSGDVELFMDRIQLIIRKIRKATVQNYGRYGFVPSKIVPSSRFDPKKMWEELENNINRISNKYLKRLVFSIYKKNKKKILIYPASVKMHYNFRSGFLEHILTMSRVAIKIAPLYRIELDLLLAGVFLHDIGKLKAIDSKYESDYTMEGNLIGDIVIGRDMVRDTINKINNFPEDLAKKIEHIVLARNETFEWESRKISAFKEALLVNLISNMNVKMNLMDNAYNEDSEQGPFTNRYNYFRTPLLKDNEPT